MARWARRGGGRQCAPLPLLPERLDGVLAVLYLIFNEGYAATSGDALIHQELCDEAIRLARALVDLLAREPGAPDDPEAPGLLALMLLHHARRRARVNADGDAVLLEDQDRGLWDRASIVEGVALLDRALVLRRAGPYQIQAAIAALHDEAARSAETDWAQIAALYATLALPVGAARMYATQWRTPWFRIGRPHGSAHDRIAQRPCCRRRGRQVSGL